MTINKTIMPYYDNETGVAENVNGYIIDLVTKDFPITITGTETKEELKDYLLKTVESLFDAAWDKFENRNDSRYIYQYGEVN